MTKDFKIRLVALIEEEITFSPDYIINSNSFDSKFKIVNFLPDIKIVKVIENGIHKRDENGYYCFDIEKKDVYKVSYTKNIKDLSVIVGKNGSGKTTVINKILGLAGRTSDERIYLILESNNEFWAYPNTDLKSISLQQNFECPFIIKFSNANEFSYDTFSDESNGIDVSNLNNIVISEKLLRYKKSEKLFELQEILNQIKFIEEFEGAIQDFVDYTKRGVILQIQGKQSPFEDYELVYLDEINSLEKNPTEKMTLNRKLVDFFSILINYIIKIDHYKSFKGLRPDYEKYLKFHLELWDNCFKIELQYEAIRDKFNFFIQHDTSNDDLKIFQFEKEIIERIELGHLLFIINQYFSYLKVKKNDVVNGYRNKMNDIFDQVDNVLLKIKDKNEFTHNGKGWFLHRNKLSNIIRNTAEILQDENKFNRRKSNEWDTFWEESKNLCSNIAKAVIYMSFFELYKDGNLLEFKLKTDAVWDSLKNVKTYKNEIEQLKRFEKLLYNSQDIIIDSTTLSSIINCLSQIRTHEILKFIQMRWIGLSSGELGLLKSFANLYLAKNIIENRTVKGVQRKNILLLLDEVDLGLHPEWQRKWISRALPIIEKIFDDKHLQIIITSHSPIFLSDIYRENILFLSKDNEEFKEKSFEKTFGQNIYTLFKNSFFLQDVMGEYAYNTIKDTIEFLTLKINHTDRSLDSNSLFNRLDEIKREKTAKKIIDSIGEPIIANQLKELFDKAFPNKNDEISEIQNQINQLQIKLRQLEEEHSQ